MRVPNAGQDLVERRIVREGKRLAQSMMADYAERPTLSLAGLSEMANHWRQLLLSALRGVSIRL